MARAHTLPFLVPEAFHANGFSLLEFDRKPIDRDPLQGFAIQWNSDLTLVHLVEDRTFRLDGYAVFRNSDVRRWRPIPKSEFLARAATLNKLRPQKPEGVTVA
jgi:hypothetical protein